MLITRKVAMPALALAAFASTASTSLAAAEFGTSSVLSDALLASNGVLGSAAQHQGLNFDGATPSFLQSPSMDLDDSIDAWHTGPHWSFASHSGGKKFDESGTAPAPGAISLLGVAGLLGNRRRRR